MPKKLKQGDPVSWNSQAGRIHGTVVRVVKETVEFKGRTFHATEQEPQYEVQSDKTGQTAMHKGSALSKR